MGRLLRGAPAILWAVGAIAVAPALASSQSGEADRGLEVIQAAAERYRQVEALCANFTQHLQVPLLGDDRMGRGRLCQARPNRFAMRFEDPAGDRIVVDGRFAWIYYPSLDPKQVIKVPVGDGRVGQDFHREFLESPERKYRVTYEAVEVISGVRAHRLRLVPRERSSYRSATLWIDDGAPVLRRIRVEEENGTVRTVTLTEVDFRASPPADWFTFTPPPGALVIAQ